MKKIFLSVVITTVFLCNSYGQSRMMNANQAIRENKFSDSVNRAKNLENAGNLEKSIGKQNELNKAKKYFEQGKEKFLAKDYSKAIGFYDKSIAINPNDKMTYYNRGICKLSLSDNKNACLDFKKAAKLGYKKAGEMISKYCK